jgi:uncharacterized protein (TIGR00369 family)
MTAKAFFDRIGLPPCGETLGWHVIEARPAEGWIKNGYDGRPEFCNPSGFVAGGFLAAMLDDTMALALVAMTDQKFFPVSLSMTVNFLAPAKPGPIIAEGRVTQLGKTIAFIEGKLLDADGTALATASTNVRLIEASKALR